VAARSSAGDRAARGAAEPNPASTTARFAAIVHEVALPVALASEAVHVLREDARALAQELAPALEGLPEARALLERIRAQAEAIARGLDGAGRLLEGFQRSASREAHGAGRVRVPLAAAVRDALVTLEPYLRKRGLRVDLRLPGDAPEAPLEVRGDETSLVEVVLNLIVNAARHAYEGSAAGRIEVEVARDPEDAGRARLTVRDFGRGIEPQDKARVFEAGFSTAPGGGTGLGLAIVRDIVTDHLSGSIACESEPGRGTAFIVRIPLA